MSNRSLTRLMPNTQLKSNDAPMAIRVREKPVELELCRNFIISDLSKLLTKGKSSSDFSNEVAPDLMLHLRAKESNCMCLDIAFTSTWKEDSLPGVYWVEIIASSLDGQTVTRREHVFSSKATRFGWSRLLKEYDMKKYPALMRDKAIQLTLHIRSIPSPSTLTRRHPMVAQFLSDSLMGETGDKVKFVLHRTRPSASHPQVVNIGYVFASRKILKESCDYFVGQEGFLEGSLGGEEDMPSFAETYDYPSDSDLSDGEGDSNGTANMSDDAPPSRYNTRKRKRGDSGNAVLVTHANMTTVKVPDIAHRTWLAVIFFIYTGDIRFKRLTSATARDDEDSGGDASGNEGADNSNSDNEIQNSEEDEDDKRSPPKVSCKSVYRVAEKIGLWKLRHRALEHLASQLNEGVIVEELFSSFTTRYPEVQEMELDYLMKSWSRTSKSPELMNKMEELGSGRLVHGIGIVKKILERTGSLKSLPPRTRS